MAYLSQLTMGFNVWRLSRTAMCRRRLVWHRWHLQRSFRRILDRIQVKGKTVPVDIYCVLGEETENETPKFLALRERHEAMLTAYKAQDWTELKGILNVCRELGEEYKLDVLYDLYEKRRQEYLANPPGNDWDGVFVATSK